MVIPLVVVALAAGIAVNVAVDAGRYVTTDNAVVDGEQIPINAPRSGTLLVWEPTLGSVLGKDEVIGRLQIEDEVFKPQQVLRSPGDGTVVLSSVTQGAYVVTGTQLAVLYDLGEVYVTARVDETDLRDVRIGALADISVDGDDRTAAGVVREIRGGTTATFSDRPPDNTAAVFDRPTQVVEVRIAIHDPNGITFLPGMNITVKIRRG
nr:HlyD family efflux transporter periplasmic adaptor subunit [Pseudonocardia sp. DSM 110487]